MRLCNGCNACCAGYLIGEVDSKKFGNMIPCHHATSTGCDNYENRPSMCTNYYCAWAQELLPEWMKPNECGVVVSVEKDKLGRQFLKAVSDKDLTDNFKTAIDKFVSENDSYYVFVKVLHIHQIK